MRTLPAFPLSPALVALLAFPLAGCGEDPLADDPAVLLPPAAPGDQLGGADADFADAAEEFAVPAELLKAISFTETRWQPVEGEGEFAGVAPAFGVMGLRGASLELGAGLVDADPRAVKTDRRTNIRAAAAVLRAHADALEIGDTDDLAAWAPAVARFSGLASEAASEAYVHDGVYGVLRRGVALLDLDGGVVLEIEPGTVAPDVTRPARPTAAPGPDYPAAIWRPSGNWDYRPGGAAGTPSIVIIHTCEGNYWGCWDWLTVPQSGVSAHYVVNETGTEISQLVREAHRGWHVGGPYHCNLNSGAMCNLEGIIVNSFAIGIEHAGFAKQASWDANMINESAKLTCDITKAWGIPRDKYHIVAHGLLQPSIRVDPGPNWPWATYLSRVNTHCGAAPEPAPTGEIVVDSNNANNDPARAKTSASSNWTATAATPGFYGSGYYYASTEAVSDAATFSFYLDAAATKTIDAWWTAGANRSAETPFVVFDSQGNKLDKVKVDQRQNGGTWFKLGTFAFKKGWNSVVVSRWAPLGSVVIADAIRVR